MVAPSRRKELDQYYIKDRATSIRLACLIFNISITCYYYQPKTWNENEQISKLLIELTNSHKNWGFNLCFLYLRNALGLRYNHKRVYRIYRELELNLRKKPNHRIKLQKLVVPTCINQSWSMDFMHSALTDGRAISLFNVIDDYNR